MIEMLVVGYSVAGDAHYQISACILHEPSRRASPPGGQVGAFPILIKFHAKFSQ